MILIILSYKFVAQTFMHTLLVVILRTKKISKWLKANSLECQIMFIYNFIQKIERPIKNHNLSSLYLIFVHLLARKPNLETFSIYSNKFFHNFHLSESSFTCAGLRASGLAQRLAVAPPMRFLEFYKSMYYMNLLHHVHGYQGQGHGACTTFNNISVILWPSVLLVEETGVPGENH